MKEYRWATLGCGVIANQLAEALAKQGRTLYAIEDMFTDDNVDIIYFNTP